MESDELRTGSFLFRNQLAKLFKQNNIFILATSRQEESPVTDSLFSLQLTEYFSTDETY